MTSNRLFKEHFQPNMTWWAYAKDPVEHQHDSGCYGPMTFYEWQSAVVLWRLDHCCGSLSGIVLQQKISGNFFRAETNPCLWDVVLSCCWLGILSRGDDVQSLSVFPLCSSFVFWSIATISRYANTASRNAEAILTFSMFTSSSKLFYLMTFNGKQQMWCFTTTNWDGHWIV